MVLELDGKGNIVERKSSHRNVFDWQRSQRKGGPVYNWGEGFNQYGQLDLGETAPPVVRNSAKHYQT